MKRYLKHSRIPFMLLAIVSLTFSVTFSSCVDPQDDVVPVQPGFVLCSDHSVMSIGDYHSSSRNDAIGVLFTKASSAHTAYAVFLHETSPVQFSDTIGVDMGTNTSIDSLCGYQNTVVLYKASKAQGNNGSPLAKTVFDSLSQPGFFIPSVAEMRILISSIATINPVIRELGGDPLSVTPTDSWYWTSTEVLGNKSYQSWICSTTSGAISESMKDSFHRVRFITSVSIPDNE